MKILKFTFTLLYSISLSFECVMAQNTFPSSGNVGIGTSSPTSDLDIRGTSESGQEQVFRLSVKDANSNYLEVLNATGTGGRFIPALRGFNTLDNLEALFVAGITSSSQDNGSNPVLSFTARQPSAKVQTRPLFSWRNLDDIQMIMTASGNLGLGTTSPTAKLSVNGSANKPGGGSWSVFSDQRLKTNVKMFEDGMNLINAINPVWFEYTGEAGMPKGTTYVGTLAQELKKIAPYMVQEVSAESGNYLTADYSALTFVLINALKEQQKEIKALQKVVQGMKENLNNYSASSFKLTDQIEVGLLQNAPNPFDQVTNIGYNVPKTSNQADLFIYDMQGKQVRHYSNLKRGNDYVEISASELEAGLYMYSLVVDGKEIDTKRMILTR